MSLQFAFGRASGGEPMPLIPIVLANRQGQSTPVLQAIVDTGADGTLAPLSILKAAGFQAGRVRRNFLTAQTGTMPEMVIGYSLTLSIGALQFPRTEVFGSRQIGEVILGRDVLNQLVFTYDGPRRVLDLLTP